MGSNVRSEVRKIEAKIRMGDWTDVVRTQLQKTVFSFAWTGYL
jgi:hypothetical protein